MTRTAALLAGAAAAALIAGSVYFAFFREDGDAFAQCSGSQIAAGEASIGGPFTLIDETGQTVTEADVFDRPALVYFGYTFCPDVCPLDNARNVVAVEMLEEQGYDVRPVFVTVDPERDTPEVVADFTANLHPRMLGLTGSPEQVREAAQAYRVYYDRQQGEDEFYLVDHTTFTYLVLPEVGFVDFFRRDADPAQIADRTACYIDAA